MARIRTIKPEFFKHETLFDAEQETGLPLRVAFAGLWTQCDREGRFQWRPRQLKTDILPYDDVDFSRVLDALATRGFVVKYASNGEVFGCIPSWHRHQVVNNRETASSIPAPDSEGTEIIKEPDACPTREERVPHATCASQSGREGKGREQEGKEGSVTVVTDADGVVDAGSPEHGKLLFRLARKAGRPSAPTEFRKLGLEEYRIEILLRTALAQKEPRSYLAGILNRQRDGPKHWNDHGTESGMSPTLERLIFDEPSTEDRDRDAGTALLAARPGTA